MGYRKKQVESTLKRAISQVLGQRLSDPRIVGMVSVTRVDVTPDWHEAFVYVSVLPQKHQQRTVRGLCHAAGHIGSLLRKQVALRAVPRLTFRLDESIKKQDTVLEAIRRGVAQDQANVWSRDAGREDSAPDGISQEAKVSQEPSA